MAWYEDIAAKHHYIYEMADTYAWEYAENMHPLKDRYEFEEGAICVSRWSSVDCCGNSVPIPENLSSTPHKLVLNDKLIDEMAISVGFRKGDWFWEHILENWQDFGTEFTIRLVGCEPVCEFDEYVSSSFEKHSSDIESWIDYIKDRYLGGDDELVGEFNRWVSKDHNRRRLVDFLCSFDKWFYELGKHLVENIKSFVGVYESQFESCVAEFAARRVAEDLADNYQMKFVKVCAEFYKNGDTIPGAVFVFVRDEVWEEFLVSELGIEIANDDYEALDMIKEQYISILTDFLDYPRDLVDIADFSFVPRR